MDKARAKLISERIAAALKGVEEELNVKITPRGGTFDPEGALMLKLEVATIQADGAIIGKEAAAFRHYAVSFGLKSDDLGKVFKANGVEYKITGLKPGASRRPLCVRRTSDNMPLVMPSTTAEFALHGTRTGGLS